jgi:hypothetical protein
VEGHHHDVIDEEQSSWDDHWRRRDREFEDFLGNEEDLKMLSNKYFFVWDGNHHLLAWNNHIDMVHKGDLDWHYCVRSIILDLKNGVTDCLMAMHNINKAIENSHVKSNLVYILHQMQKFVPSWSGSSNLFSLQRN